MNEYLRSIWGVRNKEWDHGILLSRTSLFSFYSCFTFLTIIMLLLSWRPRNTHLFILSNCFLNAIYFPVFFLIPLLSLSLFLLVTVSLSSGRCSRWPWTCITNNSVINKVCPLNYNEDYNERLSVVCNLKYIPASLDLSSNYIPTKPRPLPVYCFHSFVCNKT